MGDTGENYQTTSDGVFPGENPAAPLNPDQSALDAEIGSSGAQFLLLAGDVGYSGGTASDYGDLSQTGTDPEVSNIFGPSYFPLTGGIPTLPPTATTDRTPTTLRAWPSPVTAAASGGTYDYDSYSGVDGISASAPDDWYAFSDGNVRIYVLDAAWADNTTARPPAPATRPTPTSTGSPPRPSTSGSRPTWPPTRRRQDGRLPLPPGVRQRLPADGPVPVGPRPLLAANGVDIAFNGHAHTYQRFVPRQPGQVISYVTGGGGGVPRAGAGRVDLCRHAAVVRRVRPGVGLLGRKHRAAGPCPARQADVFNFLKVTVSGTSRGRRSHQRGRRRLRPPDLLLRILVRNSDPLDAGLRVGHRHLVLVHPAQLDAVHRDRWDHHLLRHRPERTKLATVPPGTNYTDTTTRSRTPGTPTRSPPTTRSAMPPPPARRTRWPCPPSPTTCQASLTSPTSVQLTWSPSTENQGTIASYQIDRNGVMLDSAPRGPPPRSPTPPRCRGRPPPTR